MSFNKDLMVDESFDLTVNRHPLTIVVHCNWVVINKNFLGFKELRLKCGEYTVGEFWFDDTPQQDNETLKEFKKRASEPFRSLEDGSWSTLEQAKKYFFKYLRSELIERIDDFVGDLSFVSCSINQKTSLKES